MKRSIIVCLLFCFALYAYSQDISGHVYDSVTKESIPGASVYFDGSATGTTTDMEGYFKMLASIKTHATLIISHLGYETVKIDRALITTEMKISLAEEVQKLNEVVLTADPFTRAQKMEVFKKEFLGDTKAGTSCMIDNEQDIMLFFNSHENTLSAYSKKPLLIENEFLGYTLEFEMEEFVNYFRKKSLERLDNIRFTVIAGFTRFTDNIIYDEKISKRRTKAYLGSSMHFIRSCWNNNLTDQNYGLKKNYKSVEPEELLEIIDEDNDTLKLFFFWTICLWSIIKVKPMPALRLGCEKGILYPSTNMAVMHLIEFRVWWYHGRFENRGYVTPGI